MKKAELIEKIENALATREFRTKGDEPFLQFFLEYLRRLKINHDEKYDFYNVSPYLPQITGDAFDVLKNSDEEWVAVFRESYEMETERPVPSLLAVGESDTVDRVLRTQAIGFLLKDIVGNYMEASCDAYLNAQGHVLQQFFDKFAREVYRCGLYEIIQQERGRGMSGVFGKTELRTFVMAGRLMFTFARKIEGGELTVSFLAEDDDPDIYSAGLQSVCAPLIDCLNMIEDVVRHWPKDEAERRDVFLGNSKVTLDVIAAAGSE